MICTLCSSQSAPIHPFLLHLFLHFSHTHTAPTDAEVSEATEEDRAERKKKALDDGYDAEVSEATVEANEEDRSERKKKALEDGYDADAPDVEVDAEVSEATEEERFEAENTVENESHHKQPTRDVRFEAVLETNIIHPGHHAGDEEIEGERKDNAPSNIDDQIAASQSIDEGYIPTDDGDGLTEEERGHRRSSKPPPSIDEGYIPGE